MDKKDDIGTGEGLLNYIHRVGPAVIVPTEVTRKDIIDICNMPIPPYEITFYNQEVYDEFCRLVKERFNEKENE